MVALNTLTTRGGTTQRGFTIVELLIVIVVIAILAAITIVSYNGISNTAKETALKSDLKGGATQLEVTKVDNGSYPGDANALKKADTTTFTYSTVGASYCLVATSTELAGRSYYVTEAGVIQEGTCPTQYMQAVIGASCPTSRTMVRDARDSHTYWIQKLADSKCWMLTNLAYAGGGTNTYGDVKTLSNGTADGSATYTVAKYYVVPSTTNYTTDPTEPSTSTAGTGQYGYLYNWCGATGDQQGTSACLNASTPASNPVTSICPSGWRLPTGGASGEFNALNTAVNAGSNSSDAGLIGNPWLAQRGGYRFTNAFYDQGGFGYYWSSTQSSATAAHSLYFHGSSVSVAQSSGKTNGFAVRCVAA